MNEQMKKFLREISTDKELQSELKKVNDQNLAEIAKRRGYDLAPEDFDQNRELSNEELLAVAGGFTDEEWALYNKCGKISVTLGSGYEPPRTYE